MVLDDYYSYLSRNLKQKSDHVRTAFRTHNPSVGENREVIVQEFLKEHLPFAFGVDTGLILSEDGEFSNQADLVVYDQLYNSALYPTMLNKLFLVESVYAMIEVKTHINRETIKDAIEKCVRFKKLKRSFSGVPSYPKINDSLFILWGFEGTSNESIKKNILEEVDKLSIEIQPDFIIIPDRILISMGSYRKLSKYGMEGSPHREAINQQFPDKKYEELFSPYLFSDLGQNSLLNFIVWLSSWLHGAGTRSVPLQSYLEIDKEYGYQF
ncbi:DUF6602 domain-containing protein [Pseudogracilibacillus auburnensis]|uniref:DUF6602 domain-containing protein n=1 Tax=Pseudogracilibacillus auburnensis TaxID=1494959 RepID=A0A2V3VJA6_9BACI|nr:DUF6602 domain-containing protein [Pseudogracilibacillus auburnensis]PXW81630.1 hypothetical protein DFR56_1203 [Pseudogracilibacillus auburnensis]